MLPPAATTATNYNQHVPVGNSVNSQAFYPIYPALASSGATPVSNIIDDNFGYNQRATYVPLEPVMSTVVSHSRGPSPEPRGTAASAGRKYSTITHLHQPVPPTCVQSIESRGSDAAAGTNMMRTTSHVTTMGAVFQNETTLSRNSSAMTDYVNLTKCGPAPLHWHTIPPNVVPNFGGMWVPVGTLGPSAIDLTSGDERETAKPNQRGTPRIITNYPIEPVDLQSKKSGRRNKKSQSQPRKYIRKKGKNIPVEEVSETVVNQQHSSHHPGDDGQKDTLAASVDVEQTDITRTSAAALSHIQVSTCVSEQQQNLIKSPYKSHPNNPRLQPLEPKQNGIFSSGKYPRMIESGSSRKSPMKAQPLHVPDIHQRKPSQTSNARKPYPSSTTVSITHQNSARHPMNSGTSASCVVEGNRRRPIDCEKFADSTQREVVSDVEKPTEIYICETAGEDDEEIEMKEEVDVFCVSREEEEMGYTGEELIEVCEGDAVLEGDGMMPGAGEEWQNATYSSGGDFSGSNGGNNMDVQNKSNTSSGVRNIVVSTGSVVDSGGNAATNIGDHVHTDGSVDTINDEFDKDTSQILLDDSDIYSANFVEPIVGEGGWIGTDMVNASTGEESIDSRMLDEASRDELGLCNMADTDGWIASEIVYSSSDDHNMTLGMYDGSGETYYEGTDEAGVVYCSGEYDLGVEQWDGTETGLVSIVWPYECTQHMRLCSP